MLLLPLVFLKWFCVLITTLSYVDSLLNPEGGNKGEQAFSEGSSGESKGLCHFAHFADKWKEVEINSANEEYVHNHIDKLGDICLVKVPKDDNFFWETLKKKKKKEKILLSLYVDVRIKRSNASYKNVVKV